MFEGKLLIFSAPSGAGKTTIVRRLLAQNPVLRFSISATTRQQRPGEVPERDYYFLDVETFRHKVAMGDFVEYEEVYEGLYYGTLRSEIERIWQTNHHAILDVDVQGGLRLKQYFGDRALSVFVSPPNIEALEVRLRSRQTDSEESIRRRVAKASFEISFGDRFDHNILNDELERAVAEAENLARQFLALPAPASREAGLAQSAAPPSPFGQ